MKPELYKMFLDRDYSWLSFNGRILQEASDKSRSPLDRIKFLSITADNLDEFFMVRAGGFKNLPQSSLARLHGRIKSLYSKQARCLESVLSSLRRAGIYVEHCSDLTAKRREAASEYFDRVVFPVLTPLAVDSSRPFPNAANLGLNIAARLEQGNGNGFAVIPIPPILPRFLELPSGGGRRLLLLEELIAKKAWRLFTNFSVASLALFRVTRNCDSGVDEDTENIVSEMETSIKKRRSGEPVRLEIPAGTDTDIKNFLTGELKLDRYSVYESEGPLDFAAFSRLCAFESGESLRSPVPEPREPRDFVGVSDIFAAIRERDRITHLPYESFAPVNDLLFAAARDKNVLAIKMTLYRVGDDSPVIAALTEAAENGKQITVLVEIKARFDEENNIQWARRLENAGCHVVYGLSGLKVHCKTLLIVRRDDDCVRRYLHLSTGNYNDKTARLYTDIGMFTCREEFGADASALFNHLTGYSRAPSYKKLSAAPEGLRDLINGLIAREIQNAEQGNPCGITIKANSISDRDVISRLYRASQAGVNVRLVIRGVCCLIPGVKNLSDNIEVTSIVGDFLEHSRIFKFENGGDPAIYLGSADLMPRNLDRRVELLFPVEDPVLKERVTRILDCILRDNVKARVMKSDGSYRLSRPGEDAPYNSQERLSDI